MVSLSAYWNWIIRMSIEEVTRQPFYMAVMDDKICRNELEGNFGSEIRSSYFRPSRKLSRIETVYRWIIS